MIGWMIVASAVSFALGFAVCAMMAAGEDEEE